MTQNEPTRKGLINDSWRNNYDNECLQTILTSKFMRTSIHCKKNYCIYMISSTYLKNKIKFIIIRYKYYRIEMSIYRSEIFCLTRLSCPHLCLDCSFKIHTSNPLKIWFPFIDDFCRCKMSTTKKIIGFKVKTYMI